VKPVGHRHQPQHPNLAACVQPMAASGKPALISFWSIPLVSGRMAGRVVFTASSAAIHRRQDVSMRVRSARRAGSNRLSRSSDREGRLVRKRNADFHPSASARFRFDREPAAYMAHTRSVMTPFPAKQSRKQLSQSDAAGWTKVATSNATSHVLRPPETGDSLQTVIAPPVHPWNRRRSGSVSGSGGVRSMYAG
jgi:hypothetical protein